MRSARRSSGDKLTGARREIRQYVAFVDLSYNDVAERKVHAKIELLGTADDKNPVTVKTDERGRSFSSRWHRGNILRITSPGYRKYETEIFLPSDFSANLGVMLKKEKPAPR